MIENSIAFSLCFLHKGLPYAERTLISPEFLGEHFALLRLTVYHIQHIHRAVAEYLFGIPVHTGQFRDMWKKVMFNQFHDILAGCCIKEAYDDQFASGGEDFDAAASLQTKTLCRIAANIDTYCENVGVPSDATVAVPLRHQSIPEGQPRPIVIFYSLGFSVKKTVTIHEIVEKITDDEGNEISFELVRSSEICNRHAATLFEAELPAFSYRNYWEVQTWVSQICMDFLYSDGVIFENFVKHFVKYCGVSK